MGIRYYAYAFDRDQTDEVLANPRNYISSDPFADAWGMEPHAYVGIATMEQTTPERDMAYLDKAWSYLQRLSGPTAEKGPRPAYRMFEGAVTFTGMGWDPYVHALTPAEVAEIAPDVAAMVSEIESGGLQTVGDPDKLYVEQYLRRAGEFVSCLASEGRGMAYLIG
ncbi:hypothetical protein Back2_10800 [Nocardioides baekrokdamisoli]|uniref:DUF1877 domain-containing protein n=1 Tax=Nocardioides baekrokdamisoli TaxID=1804624 RepID=A0A3G9IWR1_9ACTN|nr:DUF1877 family protein [Nocardioides baekrokdamisoli]BBH16793.1 hypothetical protein Back2_10800 [Nocardioides baekrokdamisoli]